MSKLRGIVRDKDNDMMRHRLYMLIRKRNYKEIEFSLHSAS